MLFFYDSTQRSAAIGALTPTAFKTSSTYQPGNFGTWSHIVARENLLFFYHRATRKAAIAELTPSAVNTTMTYGANRFGRWSHIINTAAGLFFYDRLTGAAAIGTFGAKSFRTTGKLAAGSLADWTDIVANGNTLLFYNRLNGAAATGTVRATGLTTTTSFNPGSFGKWTHMVNSGSTVLFYNRDTGAGAVGALTASGFTTNAVYKPGSFGVWTHVVADGSLVMFYNQETGGAAIGSLTSTAFTSTGYHQPGEFGRWSHLAGRSSSGPEELEHHVAVLLCQWERPPAWATVLSPDFYQRYFFDLSAEHGIGRFWFEQTGGRLRLTGHVSNWIALSKAPSDPSLNMNRSALSTAAINDALKAGWQPGRAQSVVVVVACDGSAGVGAGAIGAPLKISDVDRSVILLHGDSRNWILRSNENVLGSNYRFDFNAHEVGHLLGDAFSFNHAFGPAGPYDNPYCIMSAMSYGALGVAATYDRWTNGAARLAEEHTKGPGLSGATRAACGWARVRRLDSKQLKQGVELTLAHLGDTASMLPQVIECPITLANGMPATYTIEFRSPLAEADQALQPTIVLCQREGSSWSTNPTWGPRSSTYRSHAVIPKSGTLPTISESGVVSVEILEVSVAQNYGNLSGPAWVRIRLSN